MRNRQSNTKTKTCPFIEDKCMTSECGIFNEKFERCEIGLLIYNLYQLSATIKQQLELTNE